MNKKNLPRVILAGGSGSLGLRLAASFTQLGHEVFILTRNIRNNIPHKQIIWDGRTVEPTWGELLNDSILINLAGELVDRVPTEKNVRLLEDSRVKPTLALVQASKKYGGPKLWLQMSTLAIYGDAGPVALTESSQVPTSGIPQMTGVARAWEAAFEGAVAERSVILRTGVVLDRDTPALNRLVSMTRKFLGGTVASGQQYVSWIHAEDFERAIHFIVGDNNIRDVVHVTAPNPVTNRKLMATLRKTIHRPWTPPTPAFLVRIGARLIFHTDPLLALTGRRGTPEKLESAGFTFRFPTTDSALTDLLAESAPHHAQK
jgi:uncharacterized protein (TIGR01777 family)